MGKWQFISGTVAFFTGICMREPLQRELRDSSINAGFEDGINLSNEYIETLLRKHSEMIDEFPELNYPRVEAKLNEIQEALEQLTNIRQEQGQTTEEISKARADTKKELAIWLFLNYYDEKLSELQARLYQGDDSAIPELTSYRAVIGNKKKCLLAMNILVNHYLMKGDFEASEAISREAVNLAEGSDLTAYEAYFRSTIARSLSQKAGQIDLISVHRIKLTNLTGIPYETADGKQETIRKMHEYQEEADKEMSLAIRLAGESMNLEALWQVLNNFAWKEVVLAYPHFTIGNVQGIEHALRVVRSVFERLTTIAPYFSQEMVIRTYLSYSGMLSLMGKFSEALAFLRNAEAIAQKEGNNGLLAQARKMRQDIDKMIENESIQSKW